MDPGGNRPPTSRLGRDGHAEGTPPEDQIGISSLLMNGTDALIALARAFDDAGLPYMIVGSYSSNFYGVPRSTKDADLAVNLDQTDWKKLSSILPPGLELEQQSGFEMVTSTRKELIRVKNSVFEIELFHLSKDARQRQVQQAPQGPHHPRCGNLAPHCRGRHHPETSLEPRGQATEGFRRCGRGDAGAGARPTRLVLHRGMVRKP